MTYGTILSLLQYNIIPFPYHVDEQLKKLHCLSFKGFLVSTRLVKGEVLLCSALQKEFVNFKNSKIQQADIFT